MIIGEKITFANSLTSSELGLSIDEMDSESVMYASKSLVILWLPSGWNALVLHRGANGGFEWFYRVDVAFAAWAQRALRKARQAGADLRGNPDRGLRLILEHLESRDPGSGIEVDRLALSPVILGGGEILADASEFARFGFVPKWS